MFSDVSAHMGGFGVLVGKNVLRKIYITSVVQAIKVLSPPIKMRLALED